MCNSVSEHPHVQTNLRDADTRDKKVPAAQTKCRVSRGAICNQTENSMRFAIQTQFACYHICAIAPETKSSLVQPVHRFNASGYEGDVQFFVFQIPVDWISVRYVWKAVVASTHTIKSTNEGNVGRKMRGVHASATAQLVGEVRCVIRRLSEQSDRGILIKCNPKDQTLNKLLGRGGMGARCARMMSVYGHR